MKICILTPAYLPHKGGVEIVTFHMAKELSMLGHEVHIITTQEKTEKDKTFSDSTFPNNTFYVHRIRLPFRAMINHNRTIKTGLFIVSALLLLRKIRPNIVHAQNILPSIPAYFSKVFFNIPYAICVHAEKLSLTGWGILLPLCLKKYWPSLPYIKYSDVIFTLTDDNKLDIQKCLNKQSITIPNGVDLTLFKPNQIKPILQSNNLNIVCISRLEKGKGIECALHAMRSIVKQYPNSKLTIIGDGSVRKELENLAKSLKIEKNVELVGEVPNSDVPKYLASATIYLLTSFSEGFSISLLEAMAAGLPIISTPVGIAPNVCKRWNNGYLVPIKDPQAIYEAVMKITKNPRIKLEFSKNSADNVKEYAWSKIIKQYEIQYYKILGRDPEGNVSDFL